MIVSASENNGYETSKVGRILERNQAEMSDESMRELNSPSASVLVPRLSWLEDDREDSVSMSPISMKLLGKDGAPRVLWLRFRRGLLIARREDEMVLEWERSRWRCEWKRGGERGEPDVAYANG